MRTISNDVTLGQLVAERPGRAQVLEDLGLDYCCRGARTLGDACAEEHVDLTQLHDRLEAYDCMEPNADDVDLRFVSLYELIEHIVSVHHSYLRRELPRLGTLLNQVVRAHGGKHPTLINAESVFQSLCDELTDHMWKEENVLFPWIELLDGSLGWASPYGSMTSPIQVLEYEHRDAAQRLHWLTNACRPPADGCQSYRNLFAGLLDLQRDLHRHVHKENSILFPRAAALESQ
jgi:regulator of cell morphogenesis and NO signaling